MPHPILKCSAQSAAQSAPLPYPPAYNVRFPPSPSLVTRTFSTHSSAQYDRTPIQVSENICELPARGCPGRTYYDGAPSRSSQAPKHMLAGKALHPRAIAAYEAQLQNEGPNDDDDEDAQLERTPTRTSPYVALPVPPPIPATIYPASLAYSPYPLSNAAPNYPSYLPPPPLVPDLSSSSDESDGFASPPPELAAGYYGTASKYPQFGSLNPPYPQPYSYPAPAPPSSSPPSSQERKRRSRRSPPRQPVVEDGYEEEDLPGSFSHAGAFTTRAASISPPRERSTKVSSKHKSRKDKYAVATLCRSLAGTSFQEDSEGCLGGF